jgi:hypothetical protein
MVQLLSRGISLARSGHAPAQRRGGRAGRRSPAMLWTIVVLLLILWLLGFTMRVAGGLVHLLLVVALVIVVINLLTGRRTV